MTNARNDDNGINGLRKVLQVIPATMFGLLEEVIRNQRELLELPTRLEKDKLKEYSQLDRRYYYYYENYQPFQHGF